MKRVFPVLTALILLGACAPAPKAADAAAPLDPGTAVEDYRTWILGQADSFLAATEEFTAAVTAGDRARAQDLYAPARVFWERIEPVAEALGDFDPRIDAREGDVAEAEWRGYHKLEKILWGNGDLKAAAPVAAVLLTDVRLLRAQIEGAALSAPAMVTGAVELLNEISATKVTGEEERYSRTDLYDFEANLEGAHQVWQVLATPVKGADPTLAQTLDERFAAVFTLLAAQKQGEAFRPYQEVAAPDVKALASAVDALAEPLAQLGRHFPTE